MCRLLATSKTEIYCLCNRSMPIQTIIEFLVFVLNFIGRVLLFDKMKPYLANRRFI